MTRRAGHNGDRGYPGGAARKPESGNVPIGGGTKRKAKVGGPIGLLEIAEDDAIIEAGKRKCTDRRSMLHRTRRLHGERVEQRVE
jgi:hypothetical protein